MNSDTGQWVVEPDSNRDMNQYTLGQVVECNGDFWEIESIVSKLDGGRLTLRALNKDERAKLTDQLQSNLIDSPVRNRSERRNADRKLRKMLKLNGQRSST